MRHFFRSVSAVIAISVGLFACSAAPSNEGESATSDLAAPGASARAVAPTATNAGSAIEIDDGHTTSTEGFIVGINKCNGFTKPIAPCSVAWRCCGTDGWVCGLCQ